jgi:4-diphosphocytidyl-2-C-methyl-D-erythritol kinase
MISFPNAKINLGLDVLEKRQDGYHNISSIFYPVRELYDVLEIIPGNSAEDQYFFSGLSIPGDQSDNLIVKALGLIRKDFEIPSLDIYLHKVIPMGAGLGGGSSDGSFMLKILNDLFSLKLNKRELESLALELGSDCPFFIENKPVLAEGRGELMTAVPLKLDGYFIALAFSDVHISTAEAYRNVSRKSESIIGDFIEEKPDYDRWRREMVNGFEPYALSKYPQLKKVKEYFYEQGAVYSSMTGSGSAVYGIFEEPVNLKLEGFTFWCGPA